MAAWPHSSTLQNTEAKELFDRCARAEGGAWEEFLVRYQPLLFYAVRRKLGRAGMLHPERVEDCVSDTIARLLAAGGACLRAYNPHYSPSTWLVLLSMTAARDRIRREQRTASRATDASVLAFIQEGGTPPPLQAESSDLVGRIWKAVGRLSTREQIAMRMTYAQGVSNRDVGRVLRMSEMAVARMLSRCRERVRSSLEKSSVE